MAQNARLPLMLAGSLIRGAAKRLLQEPAVTNMLESAVRQLSKADITYERLASTLAVRQAPDRPQEVFDVMDVLRQIVADLPEEDIRYCDLTELQSATDPKPFLIAGWPEQLSFAFRSLLEYLLVRRPPDSRVRIALDNRTDGSLQVLFSVPTGASSESVASARPTDRISMAEQRAREAASLASEAVTLAVRRHNGEFLVDAQDGSTLAFRVELRPIQLGSSRR